jgi:8-oxo-dGTP pyrophosphatase MutT (NUDIX family)
MDQRADDDIPDLTAGVIIFDNEMNILLVKQRKNGIWSFPKGSVKYGETIYEGAIREAYEETGVDFSFHKFITMYIDTTYNKSTYLYIYKVLQNYKEIPIRLTSDTSDFIWLNWHYMSQSFMKHNDINILTKKYLYRTLKR